MALSKREKYILIFAITAILMLISDRYILSPLIDSRKQASENLQQLSADMQNSKNILKREKLFKKKWNQMLKSGFYDDAAKAESSILSYLKDATVNYGIILSSIQPEHKEGEKGFDYLEFVVAGSGSAVDVYEFMYDIETSKLPIKLYGLQLGSKDSNGSEISIQMKLSSIYVSQEPQKK